MYNIFLKKVNYMKKYIKNVFSFSKIHSTLGLIHNTIIICLFIVIILTLGSVLLEGLPCSTHWKTYCVNLMLGIDCSTLVVIVTSALQFRFEQDRVAREHNDRLFRFLFKIIEYYRIALIKKDVSDLTLKEVDNLCFDYTDYAMKLIYHSPEMKDKYDAVLQEMLTLVVEVTEHVYFSEIMLNLSIDDMNRIVDAVVSFTGKYEPKEHNRFSFLRIKDKGD